eukprot:1178292-Prorocentrum_minimum.AAC.1
MGGHKKERKFVEQKMEVLNEGKHGRRVPLALDVDGDRRLEPKERIDERNRSWVEMGWRDRTPMQLMHVRIARKECILHADDVPCSRNIKAHKGDEVDEEKEQKLQTYESSIDRRVEIFVGPLKRWHQSKLELMLGTNGKLVQKNKSIIERRSDVRGAEFDAQMLKIPQEDDNVDAQKEQKLENKTEVRSESTLGFWIPE